MVFKPCSLFNAHAEKIKKALRKIAIREVARAEQAKELLLFYQQKSARLTAAEEQLALSEQEQVRAESRIKALENDLRVYRQAVKCEYGRTEPSRGPKREFTPSQAQGRLSRSQSPGLSVV
jgi:hypothetical protein